jgi:hypothetical protein
MTRIIKIFTLLIITLLINVNILVVEALRVTNNEFINTNTQNSQCEFFQLISDHELNKISIYQTTINNHYNRYSFLVSDLISIIENKTLINITEQKKILIQLTEKYQLVSVLLEKYNNSFENINLINCNSNIYLVEMHIKQIQLINKQIHQAYMDYFTLISFELKPSLVNLKNTLNQNSN